MDAERGEHQFDALKKFMALKPDERDEFVFLQVGRIKSLLESEGVLQGFREIDRLMNGHGENAGMLQRLKWLETQVGKLAHTNKQLQRAIYIGTGSWLTIKFITDILPHIKL